MRVAACHRHGVAVLSVADTTDHWPRHAVTNEANQRWADAAGRATMACKRKTRASKADKDDLAKPSKWRLQHGRFSEPVREADPQLGSPIQHRRAVDTLGLMLNNGTITSDMHEAGCTFRTLFRTACFESVSTSQLLRIPRSGVDHISALQVDARRRVAAAMDALGGHGSPAGSCAWFVVGLECSVREWAARQGWRSRPVSQPIALGMLVAALGILTMHFSSKPRSETR
jgi:hypothetical protein